ncbi:glucose-6-phosphate dehydrogenase [Candidatus Daviesbacteria bacterium]|nr:glucose-6-phosphate dehydrogenase [Candidatus Daviesbacteria bacterium]
MSETFTLVIFGITSNLAQKYIIQALYDMEEKGALPQKMTIIGNARRKLTDSEFKTYIKEALDKENLHHQHEIKKETVQNLLKKMHYLDGNLDDPAYYDRLKEFLDKIAHSSKGRDDRIYYLATYPDLYKSVFENLSREGLTDEKEGFVRLMIEKPLGHDFKSAKQINKLMAKYFKESQIYRMDHYLGKETLQSILTFRFGNGLFEPLINKDYVDHIQITASEDFGIGSRGGYYDTIGALKDVGQNHQMQMLAFATMDAPDEFSNEAVTKQRISIIKSLQAHPEEVVFGQYKGYTKEENVAHDSKTDTFYAFKASLKNERFNEVPIYVRAGKMLEQTVTEISIIFKTPHNRLFKDLNRGMEPNVLIYRIQPNEGIVVRFLSKKPGSVELEENFLQYCYRLDASVHSHLFPDPYEKLILDAIQGDQTFFADAEEIEASWKFVDGLTGTKKNPIIYEPGSWGPEEADELIQKDGREWLIPSNAFCNIPLLTR